MIFPIRMKPSLTKTHGILPERCDSKKKPRVANGTYSHRLSGLVYCADCGSRMGFISPEANHSETHYDSDSAFQCGNYRSKSGECVSHYVKTSVLEAAILQAIQAVSKYVLENEDRIYFSSSKPFGMSSRPEQQTTAIRNLPKQRSEWLNWTKKINKLYESTLSGLLPERQAQRMIQQYDEEQILLERRVAELENLVQQDEIKQVDASRFIALVKKYRDCEELTDTMLCSLTGLRFTKPQAVERSTASRTLIFISISSATTTRLLKLFPRKNALPPSKPNNSEKRRKRANARKNAESKSCMLMTRSFRKPETRSLSHKYEEHLAYPA